MICGAPCCSPAQPCRSWAKLVHRELVPVVGLIFSSPSSTTLVVEPFVAGMRALGWAEGENFILEHRATHGDLSRTAELVRELQQRHVVVLVTLNTSIALEARRAAPSLPIVMMSSGYPVEIGLAESYARPGGMVTGFTLFRRHGNLRQACAVADGSAAGPEEPGCVVGSNFGGRRTGDPRDGGGRPEAEGRSTSPAYQTGVGTEGGA